LMNYTTPYVQMLMQKFGTNNIICTGHSLGAAMAQIAALDLSETFASANVSSVTYGTPRTGNYDWQQYWATTLKGQTGRIVHYHDIVPHLPPEALLFHHTPNEAWYNDNMTQYAYCADGEDRNCSDGTIGDSVSDHLRYYQMSSEGCHPETLR
jgi:pimeloyl-ACP methyl ester carboxylesterase